MKRISSPLSIACLYFLLGISWIFFTDKIAFADGRDISFIHQVQNYKGFFYIFFTSVALYFLVRKSLATIRERGQEYELLFEENPNPMFILDPSRLHFLAVNRAALEQYGYSREEFLAISVLDIRPPQDKERFLQWISQSKGSIVKAGTWRHLDKNGEILDVNIFQHPVKFKGSPAVLVMALNITAQKKAEEERNQLIQTLSLQNQNLQQFAFITSHNLRAPVANIIGLTNLFSNRNEEALNGEIIANLGQAAGQMDEVIRDLNELLEIRSTKEINQDTVVLGQVLPDVMKDLEPELTAAGGRLVLDLPEGVTLPTNAAYIQSIFRHLIQQAVKSKSPARNLLVRVNAQEEAGFLVLQVRDNGLGNSGNHQPAERVNLKQMMQQMIKGKGLGLHLVNAQAEALGGCLEVESTKDIGTAYRVFLPKAGVALAE